MERIKFELSLTPALQQRLEHYRTQHDHQDLVSALLMILETFLAQQDSEDCAQTKQIHKLEKKLDAFSQELIALRQQVPNDYDQLRGQLAAIHLSHSGLLGNLRERLEVLEASILETSTSQASLDSEKSIATET